MPRNNLSLTKSQKRIILRSLETLYENRLLDLAFKQKYNFPNFKKTAISDIDRTFRSQIKSCEILLHLMGSKLMQDVKTPSIRRTLDIKARHCGAFQGERTFVDNSNTKL